MVLDRKRTGMSREENNLYAIKVVVVVYLLQNTSNFDQMIKIPKNRIIVLNKDRTLNFHHVINLILIGFETRVRRKNDKRFHHKYRRGRTNTCNNRHSWVKTLNLWRTSFLWGLITKKKQIQCTKQKKMENFKNNVIKRLGFAQRV